MRLLRRRCRRRRCPSSASRAPARADDTAATLDHPVRTDRHRRVAAPRRPADLPAGRRRRGHDRARGRPDAGGVRGFRDPRRGARPAERRPGVPVGAASSPGWPRRATSSRRSAGPADGERSFIDAVDVLRGLGATEVAFVGASKGGMYAAALADELDPVTVVALGPPAEYDGHDARSASSSYTGPLLVIASTEDRSVPASVVEAGLPRGRPQHVPRAQRQRARRRAASRGSTARRSSS